MNMKVFYLIESEKYEPDVVVGIFSTAEKAREIYDADLAAPYGQQRAGNLECYEITLDEPKMPWEKVF